MDIINDDYPIDPSQFPKASELLNQTFPKIRKAIAILINSPQSNLVQLLKNAQSLGNKIEMIEWIAGAFYTGANVQTYQYYDSA